MRSWLGLLVLASTASLGAAELTVDEIVARNIAARGGAARLQAIRSLRLTGTAVFGGGDFQHRGRSGRRSQKRPGLVRTEVTLQGLTAVDAYDGKEGWSIAAVPGPPRCPSARRADDAQGARRSDADIDGPLVDWREKGHRIEYLGTEDVDGTAAHKLRVTRKDGDIAVRLPRPRLLPRDPHRDRAASVRGVEHVSETDLGNYEQVAGVLDPVLDRDRRARARPRSQRITVERAEANVAADDALLPLPAAGTQRWRARHRRPGPRRPPRPRAARRRRRAGGRAPSRRGRHLRPRRAQHRLGDDERPHRGGRRATTTDGKTTLYVGAATRRRLEVARRRHDVQAGVRQAAGAVDRRDRHRPVATRRRSGSAPARPGRATPSRSATASTSRPTAARPGRNMGLPESERIARIVVHPKNGDVVYACVPGQALERLADRGLYKTDRRRQDAGRSCSRARTCRPAARASTMDPKNPDVAVRRACGTSAARAGRSAPAATAPDAPSGSGALRSTDGGKTWTELDAASAKGLPAEARGAASRSSIAPSRPEARLRAHRVDASRRSIAPTTAARPGRRATTAR